MTDQPAESPSDVIRRAAALMRDRAQAAARPTDPADHLLTWDVERVAHQERVIEVRRYPDGTDHAVIAVPTVGGIAEHIAGMHPGVALAIANLLDAIATGMGHGDDITVGVLPSGEVGFSGGLDDLPDPTWTAAFNAARRVLGEPEPSGAS